MITKEQVQELVNTTSKLVEREDGLPWVKQPLDNAVEVSRRLAKRVLELEESYSYIKAYRDDLQDEVLDLEDKVKENITNAKHFTELLEDDLLKEKGRVEQLTGRLKELEALGGGGADAQTDEGCDSEA
jgi:uncharacterized protein Yka (UPF0111/DUF47 family)